MLTTNHPIFGGGTLRERLKRDPILGPTWSYIKKFWPEARAAKKVEREISRTSRRVEREVRRIRKRLRF